jgi:peptidoglycan hydrolase CwlO-like protein
MWIILSIQALIKFKKSQNRLFFKQFYWQEVSKPLIKNLEIEISSEELCVLQTNEKIEKLGKEIKKENAETEKQIEEIEKEIEKTKEEIKKK